MTDPVWNEEQIATLRAGWSTGLPIREIASQLGRTKEAVIGKAWRLQLGPYVEAAKRTVPFDELDLIPLPRSQRAALAALLEVHPRGLTADELARWIFDDVEHHPSRPEERARSVLIRLRRKLNPLGWDCRSIGDRKGIRLVTAREQANG